MSTPRGTPVGSRRLLTASLLLGLFVLFDLGLLGWLLFRSLSQREIEQVLLETRTDAENLAEQLAVDLDDPDKDLYTLIATEQEKQTYIDTILQKRDHVQTVEIRDNDGKLVFRARAEKFDPPELAETLDVGVGEVTNEVISDTRSEQQIDYDMNVPIGELGILHIGISHVELERRIGVLRGELVRQTTVIGAVTLVVLLLAYLTIWWLWRRSRRLEEQAAEAERMAYIGTLASGLAHEIRNPLNSLNLNMQLLEEESGPGLKGSSTGKLLSITRNEIGRLERLVTDFLRYARPRPLELCEIPAVRLLERCGELLAGEFESRGAGLVVEDLTGGAKVNADPEQLTQLLINLAQNALAATEDTGRPAQVRLRAEREGASVCLEVEDNGVGIPPEESARIFDLFYSTRKGGTGLGLAVVKRVAQTHGGEVDLESTPGVGTRFVVRLPEVAEAGEPAQAAVQVDAPSTRLSPGET